MLVSFGSAGKLFQTAVADEWKL